jgi:amino acid permease
MVRRVLPLVASIAVLVIGLGIGFLADVGDDMRFFGWLLAAIGVVGLLSQAWIAGQGGPR